jgi:hypothetical protein
MAYEQISCYFYDSSRQLTKQGSLTYDSGTGKYTYSATLVEIVQGEISTTRLAVVVADGSFDGYSPFITVRTPQGWVSQPALMAYADWTIIEDTTETLYKVAYIDLDLVGFTRHAGVHVFVPAWLYSGVYTPMAAGKYTVEDGVNDYEDIEADNWATIYNSIEASFTAYAERLVEIENYLAGAFDYIGGQVDGTRKIILYNLTQSAILTFDGSKLVITIDGTAYSYALLGTTNTFTEVNTFVSQILAQAGIDVNSAKIVNVANGTTATDAINKGQHDLKADITYVDSQDNALDARVTANELDIATLQTGKEDKTNKITAWGTPTDVQYPSAKLTKDTLDTKETIANVTSKISTHNSAEDAHTDIRALISALQGAYVFRGLISNTTAEITADTTLLTTYIDTNYGRVPTIGDVLVDTDDNEWYYDGDSWENMGQAIISLASAVSDGLMSKEDYAKLLAFDVATAYYKKTDLDTGALDGRYYTETELGAGALDSRYYTESEVDALLDALKAVYGWQSSDLANDVASAATVNNSIWADYDMILLVATDGTNTYTELARVADLIDGDTFTVGAGTFVIGTTTSTFTYAGFTLDITGIKMDGTVHNEMRSVGAETITYRDDGKISTVVADTVTTTPTYDEYGNITKITEVYALDGKTYETTFTYDKFGRISATNKVEV